MGYTYTQTTQELQANHDKVSADIRVYGEFKGEYTTGSVFTLESDYYIYDDGTSSNYFAVKEGVTLPYTATEADPNNDVNLVLTGSASTEYVKTSVTESEERLLGVGSLLYKGSNGSYIQDGDTVPVDTTHLSVLINGKVEDVRLSSSVSGVVADLTETSAIVGGVSVTLHRFLNGGYQATNSELLSITPLTGEQWFNTTDNTIHMGNGSSLGGVKQGVHVNVKQFGAKGDGVTDDTLAIKSAIDYVINNRTTITPNGNENNISIVGDGVFVISDQIEIPRSYGSNEITGVNLILDSIIVPTWSGSPGDPALLLNNPKSYFKFKLDCMNSGCAGVFQEDSYDQFYDNIEVYRFQNYGIKYSGDTGNCVYLNPTSQQWRPEHGADFENLANRTAKCFVIDGNDCRIHSGNLAWGALSLEVTVNAVNNILTNTHIWTGGTDLNPTIDATIIETYTNNGIHFHNCYFDNGHIDIYADSIVIQGGMMIKGPAATTNDPVFRWYADGGAQPFFTAMNDFPEQNGSIAFLSNGGDSWLGDYSVINATVPDVGWLTNVARTMREVFPQDEQRTSRLTQTPGGTFVHTYNIGSKVIEQYAADSGDYVVRPEAGSVLRVNARGDATPHAIKFGGGDVGIAENNAATLDVNVFGGTYWRFNDSSDGGRLFPLTDNLTDFGSGSNRIKEIFAVNGTINTSDGRLKTFEDIPDVVLDAWAEVPKRQYKWNDSIERENEGGSNARWHIGVIAQDIIAAFNNHGLNATDYAVLCWDEWEEQKINVPAQTETTTIINDNGEEQMVTKVIKEGYVKTIPSGERYGVRYNQAAQLDSALERRERAKLEDKINQLLGDQS